MSGTYKLYACEGTGSAAPEMILEDSGIAYERVDLDYEGREYATAENLKLNPRAQVPFLALPDGTVMTESAAICIDLSDRLPNTGLLAQVGSSARSTALRWTIFLAVNIYETFLRQEYAHRYTTTAPGSPGIEAAARDYMARHWKMMEQHAWNGDGPFLLGDTCSVADIYMTPLALWSDSPAAFLESHPNLARAVRGVLARPGSGKAIARNFPDLKI